MKKYLTHTIIILLVISISYFVIFNYNENQILKISDQEVQNLIQEYVSPLDGQELKQFYAVKGENWDGYDLQIKLAESGPIGNSPNFKKRRLDTILPYDKSECYAIGGVYKIDSNECKITLKDSMIKSINVFAIVEGIKYTLSEKDVSVEDYFQANFANLKIPITAEGTVFYDITVNVVCKQGETQCINNESFICKTESFSTISHGEPIEGEKIFLENTNQIC